MTSTWLLGTHGILASLSAASLYQWNYYRNHKIYKIKCCEGCNLKNMHSKINHIYKKKFINVISRQRFGWMTVRWVLGTHGILASLSAASLYQWNYYRNHKIYKIKCCEGCNLKNMHSKINHIYKKKFINVISRQRFGWMTVRWVNCSPVV